MRSLPLLAVLGALVVPTGFAQNDTTPTQSPGMDEFGPQESLELQPGITYGVAVVIGTVAVGVMLAFVMRKQKPRH